MSDATVFDFVLPAALQKQDKTSMHDLPEDLKSKKIFLFSRLSGRAPKAPLYLRDADGATQGSSWTSKENWMTFDAALAAAETCGGQIGVALDRDDDLCCVDLDGVVPPEASKLSADAELKAQEFFRDVVALFAGKAYIERSYSGRGLHIFFRAKNVPVAFSAAVDAGCHRGVEFYSADRYILLGQPLVPDQPLSLCDNEAQAALEMIANWRTQQGLPAAWKVAREREANSNSWRLEDRRLNDIVDMMERDLAEKEIEISDIVFKRVPGEHARIRLTQCPNCMCPDRPAIFLYEGGFVVYKCFHENRCAEFGIEEFCDLVGLQRLYQPWEFNSNMLDETTPELQAAKIKRDFEELERREEARRRAQAAEPQKPVESSIPLELRERMLAKYRVYTPGDLLDLELAGELEREYLIQDLMLKGQPMVIGGTEKALKTSLTVAACVSLTSGESFLGRQVAPGKGAQGFRRLTSEEPSLPEAVRQTGRSVLLFSGESGLGNINRLLRRIAIERLQGYGIDEPSEAEIAHARREEMGGLKICPLVPPLTNPAGRLIFRELLQEHKPDVAIIDPAYMAFPGDGAANMFQMGEHLGRIVEYCNELGVTPAVLHHVGKAANKSKGLSLNDLAWAGWGQWAGQWMLLSRQNIYEGAVHRLRLQAGNREGDFWDLGVEVVERPEGSQGGYSTLWRCSWRPWKDAQTVWSGKAVELTADEPEDEEPAQPIDRIAECLEALEAWVRSLPDDAPRFATKTMLAAWSMTGSFETEGKRLRERSVSSRNFAIKVYEALETRPGWEMVPAQGLIQKPHKGQKVPLWRGSTDEDSEIDDLLG